MKKWRFVDGRKLAILKFVSFSITVSILLVAFTHAQSTPKEYEIKTIVVFPDSITSDSWSNIETLNSQDLSDSAVYQNFNKNNSAYPSSAKSVHENTISTETDNVASTSSESVHESTSTSVTESIVQSTSTPETNTDALQSVENVAVPQSPSDSVASSTSQTEFDAVPTTLENEPIDTPSSSTTVLQKVRDTFAFVVESVIDTITNPMAADPAPVSDEVQPQGAEPSDTQSQDTPAESVDVQTTDEVIPQQSFDVITSTSSLDTTTSDPNDQPISSSYATDTMQQNNQQQGVSKTIEPSVDVNKSNTPALSDKPSNSNQGPSTHHLTFSGFGLPLDEGTDVVGGQLRLSYAAKERTEFINESPELTINYSLDNGQTWQNGGSIKVDDETSNALNGGYFLFALPQITTSVQLNALVIDISYTGVIENLAGMYLDSAWLELFAEEPKEVQNAAEQFVLPDNNYSDYQMVQKLISVFQMKIKVRV